MAREVRHFTVTIPAGTPIATPVTTSINFFPRKVHQIYWRVPNGPQGQMGWRLTMHTIQVLPTPGSDLWVIANDEHDTWTVDEMPDSGAWEVTGYNTGAYSHSVYLAFSVNPTSRPAELRGLIGDPFLNSAGDLSKAGPPLPPRLSALARVR